MFRRVAAMVAVVGGLVLSAAPAHAINVPIIGSTDCKTAPTPDGPGSGIPGFFEPDAPPTTGTIDPAGDRKFELYGWAGMRWTTYDLGCGSADVRDPSAVGGTTIANWVFAVPQAVFAFTSSVTGVAFHPTWLGVFDPLITRLVATLQTNLFDRWVGVPILIIGVTVLWGARRGNVSSVVTMVGAALFVMVIAVAVFNEPTAVGHQTDRVMTGGITAVESVNNSSVSDPALAAEEHVYNDVVYPFWLAGELGSSTSPTAVKYGPVLLAETAYTWDEQAACHQSATVCKAITDHKQSEFKTTAGEIHDTDPSAYAHLTGHASDDRVGFAMLALFACIVLVPFLILAALLVVASYAIIRLAVVMSPAVALVGIRVPKVARAALSAVAAAVINSVVFALGSAILIDVIGVTLNPDLGLPVWLGVLISAVFGWVMWHLLKPLRKLTSMMSASNPVADAAGVIPGAGRKVIHTAFGAAKTFGAAYVGGRVAGHVAADEIDEREQTRSKTRAETSTVSTPTTTADAPVVVPASLSRGTTPVDGPDAAPAGTGPALPVPPPTPVGGGTVPARAIPAPAAPRPVVPSPDGTYEVYDPGMSPTDAPLAPTTDDGAYQIWTPEK